MTFASFKFISGSSSTSTTPQPIFICYTTLFQSLYVSLNYIFEHLLLNWFIPLVKTKSREYVHLILQHVTIVPRSLERDREHASGEGRKKPLLWFYLVGKLVLTRQTNSLLFSDWSPRTQGKCHNTSINWTHGKIKRNPVSHQY